MRKYTHLIVTRSAACWKSYAHLAKCSKNFSNAKFERLMVQVLKTYGNKNDNTYWHYDIRGWKKEVAIKKGRNDGVNNW